MSIKNKKSYPFSVDRTTQLLSWADKYKYFAYFNGNDHSTLHDPFPHLLFVGKRKYVESHENSFSKLNQLIDESKGWLYGYLSYDLKNEIEFLESKNPATVPVNHLAFYEPEIIIHMESQAIKIESSVDPDGVYSKIFSINKETSNKSPQEIGALNCNTSKKQFIDHVEKIKSEIVEGEFYEMNYCIEFTATTISFDPLRCYLKLNSISPMPFSGIMRFGNIYLISASPERFLKKEKSKIISQPIKGTIRRGLGKVEDEFLKKSLQTSEKERAENLMIVDLVRNDLAKSAITGSVKVDELFGIYTFQKLHQMISTVTATHKKDMPIAEILKHAFPMGSMTGAPKIRVMEEIDLLESSSRGLYSGAVGFLTPDQDFDFNVVIRSLIYNSSSGKISFHVGSAITFDSDPEYEYNECLLKAESLMEVLSK